MATIQTRNEELARYADKLARAVIRLGKKNLGSDDVDMKEAYLLARTIQSIQDWTITGR